MQTMMMTGMMNMQGLYNLAAQQDKIDAKLEIAQMNYEARSAEAEMVHEERMTELADSHVEKLAEMDAIQLDSKNYQYPYQWGTA